LQASTRSLETRSIRSDTGWRRNSGTARSTRSMSTATSRASASSTTRRPTR
jgi:hypothetical protein